MLRPFDEAPTNSSSFAPVVVTAPLASAAAAPDAATAASSGALRSNPENSWT